MPRLSGVVWLIDRLVLGDQMMWLRRLCVQGSGCCFGRGDIFFEDALLNELFQVLSEGPTVDGLVPFGFVVGAVFLRSEKRGIVLDLSWTSDPWLILDGVEDLIDREPQWSEVYH